MNISETERENHHQVKTAMQNLDRIISDRHQNPPVLFEAFLKTMVEKPHQVLRNVFQVFYDMVKTYVEEGEDEYPDDPESIHFVNYDCTELFVEGSDHPFFADRLFANRFIEQVESLRRGTQQNKIYIFDGPPGCGKSTFLNNLLMKFEEYTKTDDGSRYESVWRLDRNLLCRLVAEESVPLYDKVVQVMAQAPSEQQTDENDEDSNRPFLSFDQANGHDLQETVPFDDAFIDVPCPSHDHPIVMIPKHYRRKFLDDLLSNDEFKWKLFTEKEYEWIFRDPSCTICSSIYWALLRRLKNPLEVFRMLYARPYQFNRRLGEGISVFNPGDRPMRQNIMGNPVLQNRINNLLRDSNQVKYIFSRYAKTNNGIYALMDIKSHNVERLIELHNIISEGVHKVEDIEENVNSLLMALMNPEDKKNVQNLQSFSDRIEYINIPYVLDLNTEIAIYRNIFGKHIDESFLPRVLHNFARVIISTRLSTKSEALLEWIGDPKKYSLYCDENLQLLKMEIYTGYIPSWLTEEDRKRFTAKRRRKIIAESVSEGIRGFSGRDSIKIFNEFYAKYAREDKLIDMSTLCMFFTKVRKDLSKSIPERFLLSLLDMYDYTILQEVKESLYYYNEEQIARDLQNYLFASNFEIGSVATCSFTGDRIEISDVFFESIERRLLGEKQAEKIRLAFREETQKTYAAKTLTQEVMLEGIPVTETELYQALHERYVFNLKEKVLEPFLKNENFRQAIKDFNEESFKSHDRRIRDDVTFLMNNLCEKCKYIPQGAKEICIYVIDNELANKFAK
ncbi:MAG: serine protein kinase PrkA [Deltaproteobacteria bacterium]|nr:serine protein kinase PrkA [Deltaproteobacteria bacterium]